MAGEYPDSTMPNFAEVLRGLLKAQFAEGRRIILRPDQREFCGVFNPASLVRWFSTPLFHPRTNINRCRDEYGFILDPLGPMSLEWVSGAKQADKVKLAKTNLLMAAFRQLVFENVDERRFHYFLYFCLWLYTLKYGKEFYHGEVVPALERDDPNVLNPYKGLRWGRAIWRDMNICVSSAARHLRLNETVSLAGKFFEICVSDVACRHGSSKVDSFEEKEQYILEFGEWAYVETKHGEGRKSRGRNVSAYRDAHNPLSWNP